MYLVTVLGNLLIILLVSSDSHLHTPMYIFLSNLSLTDFGFISITVPKMLVNIQTHKEVVSYLGCLTQKSLFAIFGLICVAVCPAVVLHQEASTCDSMFMGMLATESEPLLGTRKRALPIVQFLVGFLVIKGRAGRVPAVCTVEEQPQQSEPGEVE
ncbi:Hypothetical predicted protein [Marmota monax]|uniref:G-protein coupled receptors family 1 profile domain-containing protein n=1 Tax=Marmota monax TaxID=9995 RepID=A0A5E4AWL3_MARMO|nr:hypothetical protein GHT09_003992 [Marmota monax]VTJ61525.1 Hypothetical predicted protein [Marmota monax]